MFATSVVPKVKPYDPPRYMYQGYMQFVLVDVEGAPQEDALTSASPPWDELNPSWVG